MGYQLLPFMDKLLVGFCQPSQKVQQLGTPWRMLEKSCKKSFNGMNIRCNECGTGPWSSRQALRACQIRKHGYCRALQAPVCPNCGRRFATKSAARRHVQRQSCHKPVSSHGRAGAIAGQVIVRAHAAARAQATPLPPVRAQASERSIADFFARGNGWRGLPQGRPSQSNQSAVRMRADSSDQLSEPPALGEAATG